MTSGSKKQVQPIRERGFALPNYTQTPNRLFRQMPVMSNSALRVLLAVVRRTFGWQKQRDLISLTTLVADTGLSRRAVIAGIREAEVNGVLVREPVNPDEPWQGMVYSLSVYDADGEPDLEWQR